MLGHFGMTYIYALELKWIHMFRRFLRVEGGNPQKAAKKFPCGCTTESSSWFLPQKLDERREKDEKEKKKREKRREK